MSNSPFAWNNLNRQQRGDWVRRSFKDCLYDRQKLADLFQLTDRGVEHILGGGDWSPTYQREEPAPAAITDRQG